MNDAIGNRRAKKKGAERWWSLLSGGVGGGGSRSAKQTTGRATTNAEHYIKQVVRQLQQLPAEKKLKDTAISLVS